MKCDPDDIFGDEFLSMQPCTTQVENYPFKLKLALPTGASSNVVGLLLGPRGTFQKKLEE